MDKSQFVAIAATRNKRGRSQRRSPPPYLNPMESPTSNQRVHFLHKMHWVPVPPLNRNPRQSAANQKLTMPNGHNFILAMQPTNKPPSSYWCNVPFSSVFLFCLALSFCWVVWAWSLEHTSLVRELTHGWLGFVVVVVVVVVLV